MMYLTKPFAIRTRNVFINSTKQKDKKIHVVEDKTENLRLLSESLKYVPTPKVTTSSTQLFLSSKVKI